MLNRWKPGDCESETPLRAILVAALRRVYFTPQLLGSHGSRESAAGFEVARGATVPLPETSETKAGAWVGTGAGSPREPVSTSSISRQRVLKPFVIAGGVFGGVAEVHFKDRRGLVTRSFFKSEDHKAEEGFS